VHEPYLGAPLLATAVQGETGLWLADIFHTPDVHSGTLIRPLYIALGRLARITPLNAFVWFHIARVGAGLLMLTAMYQLGAQFWTRVRSRRAFFVVTALASGLGWIWWMLTGDPEVSDLTQPLLHPLLALAGSVHVPLALALLALAAGTFVRVLEPGNERIPDALNGGAVLIGSGLGIALLLPGGLVTLSLTVITFAVIRGASSSRMPWRELRWLAWFLVPAIPVLVYPVALASQQEHFALWLAQQGTRAPSPSALVIGFALPLMIGLPGMWSVLRRRDVTHGRLMGIWLAVMVLLMLLPGASDAVFGFGIALPLGYFATQSLETHWLPRLQRRWWLRLVPVAITLLLVSPILVLMMPAVLANQYPHASRALIRSDYYAAMVWLEQHTVGNEAVLAAPDIGLWLPVWAERRPVYGHPQDTLAAASRYQLVLAWYRESATERCAQTMTGPDWDDPAFRVAYVLYGPLERQIGPAVCMEDLTPIGQVGEVAIYRVPVSEPGFDARG
jgi:hypothetical protein